MTPYERELLRLMEEQVSNKRIYDTCLDHGNRIARVEQRVDSGFFRLLGDGNGNKGVIAEINEKLEVMDNRFKAVRWMLVGIGMALLALNATNAISLSALTKLLITGVK